MMWPKKSCWTRVIIWPKLSKDGTKNESKVLSNALVLKMTNGGSKVFAANTEIAWLEISDGEAEEVYSKGEENRHSDDV